MLRLEALLVPLAEIPSAEVGGGKAWSLAELVRAGIAVPETYVIPAGSEVELDEALDDLGGTVAVRSSATLEDQSDLSFAGQFRSVLDVASVTELRQAIHACRESVHTETVRAYCAAGGVDVARLRMAVIVQRMVKARAAGVLFTVNPVSGDEGEMLIEAVPGTAEDLLAGRVSGERLSVRDGVATPSPLLSPDEIRALHVLGQEIQRLKGAPQDIEWAVEGTRIYVLQARPITRLGFRSIPGEWTTADFRDGGVASGVVSPLLWSLYEAAWGRAIKGFLRDLRLFDADFHAARLFFGRPYWNLGAVKRSAMRLPGFVEREFDLDLAVQPTYDGDGVRTPVNLRNVVRALPTLVAAGRVLKAQERRARALLADPPWRPLDLEARDLPDTPLLRTFERLLDEVYFPVEEAYFRTIFCASIAKLDLTRVTEDLPVSHAALVGGLDALDHVGCAQALWELGNVEGAALGSFLTRFGHHSRRELDLRVPRWSEEPALVREMAARLHGTPSPAHLCRRQREQYLEARRHARTLLPPWRRRGFDAKLSRLRTFLWLREQMRDLSTRTYALVRCFVLEIGRRAAPRQGMAEGDVFYLTYGELGDAFGRRWPDTVAARRAHEEMYRSFEAPREVGHRFVHQGTEPVAGRLVGIACSAGMAVGPARIVRTSRDADRVVPGDVLVCPYIDPGWTPLLGLAAAVVTECGGLLSHAAVLCREYGIPAVLNVSGATRALREGQILQVDGARGHVDVV